MRSKVCYPAIENEKASPQYQLQKYYPEIHDEFRVKQYEKMSECTLRNLERELPKVVSKQFGY